MTGVQTCALPISVVAGTSAYGTLIFVVDGVNQETFIGILLQGGVAGIVGVVGAIFTYYIFKSKELDEIYRSLHAKFFKKDVIGPQ